MKPTRYMLPLVAAIALGACDDSSIGGVGDSRLSIRLTDAPGDLEEAQVKISKFVLIRSDDGVENDSTDDRGSRFEFTPLETDYINLLDLTNGAVMEMVDEAEVPSGNYKELRLVLDEAYVVLKDGRVFATAGADLPAGVEADGTLKCPSCSQSGYKVKFSNDGLTIDGNTIVTVDFDAGKSFGHEAGKSGQWIMHPVLRATTTTVRLAGIYGKASLANGVTIPQCGGQANTLAAFRPRAITASDTLLAVTDTLGNYRISNLLPAVFALSHVTDVTFTNGDSLTFAATPTNASVTLAQGDSIKVDYSITAATCH